MLNKEDINRCNVIERVKGIGTITRNPEDDVLKWSEGLNRLLQTNEDKTSLLNLLNYFPEKEKKKLRDFHFECMNFSRRKGETFEMRIPGEMTRHIKIHIDYERGRNNEPLNEYWVFQDISKPVQREKELITQRDTDGLTGILNYSGLQNSLEKYLRIGIKQIGVIQVDMDEMKSLNDIYGHHHGDYALQTTANILKSSVREEDLVARVGGDEFRVLCPEIGDSALKQVINRIELEKRDYTDFNFSLGYSFGNINDLDKLVKLADKNMYSVKRDSSLFKILRKR